MKIAEAVEGLQRKGKGARLVWVKSNNDMEGSEPVAGAAKEGTTESERAMVISGGRHQTMRQRSEKDTKRRNRLGKRKTDGPIPENGHQLDRV